MVIRPLPRDLPKTLFLHLLFETVLKLNLEVFLDSDTGVAVFDMDRSTRFENVLAALVVDEFVGSQTDNAYIEQVLKLLFLEDFIDIV